MSKSLEYYAHRFLSTLANEVLGATEYYERFEAAKKEIVAILEKYKFLPDKEE